MNYFEFYVGDYKRDTGRLSMAEHGAFLMLLADYYANERPLPAQLPDLYRIAGAQGKAEQLAVRSIADLFFPIDPEDGLRHNARADAEITKAQKRINAARANGVKGGRKQNPVGNPVGTPPGTQRAAQQVTHSGEALQTPHAKDQKHESSDEDSSAPADADAPAGSRESIPYQAIVDAYNAALTGLAKVREVTAKRRTLIRSAWQASPARRSLRFWQAYFAECQDDDFLNGTGPYRSGHENWRPSFDYLLRADVVTRVYEAAMDRMERGE